MQHSNSSQDHTHPKVHTLRNMESSGINCSHNSSGFLICIFIYLYVHASLDFWYEKFSVVYLQRSFSKQRRHSLYCTCHTAVQQTWLQRGHPLKGHHQEPTSTAAGQGRRKKSVRRIPWSECFTVGLSGSWCDFTATLLCFRNVFLHWAV